MNAESFGPYLRNAVAEYAADNVAAGRWPEAGALQRSAADFDALLPQGVATPDHFLFDILATPEGPAVGALWFAVVDRHTTASAFVYDLLVRAEHRRQGHAQRAFQAMESIVRGLGLTQVGLHVFGHNPAAQALYTKLGYGVTGLNMARQLDTVGPLHAAIEPR